ncbi:MAG: DUF4389 domain-containing protein [Chloroflexi bacterium]|nr:DUF4389 domain-containing protein [Chloroflexota bacterium]
MTQQPPATPYALRLSIDYPDRPLHRLTTFFRIIWIIPVAVVAVAISGGYWNWDWGDRGQAFGGGGGGVLFLAVLLVILFRQKYPRWWFDFNVELTRFGTRIWTYLALLTDVYPSTDEHQAVHLDVDYPDAKRDLNRWLPLVKWLLAIPHYVVLIFLTIAAVVAVIIAWFAILFTGRYPRGLFDYVVGVGRWVLRVQAYAFLLVTDRYPPFSLA